MFNQFAQMAFNSAMLAWESQEVICLRVTKMAVGGAAASDEANLMLSEKVSAFFEAATTAATGGSADSILLAYREKVGANRLRLS